MLISELKRRKFKVPLEELCVDYEFKEYMFRHLKGKLKQITEYFPDSSDVYLDYDYYHESLPCIVIDNSLFITCVRVSSNKKLKTYAEYHLTTKKDSAYNTVRSMWYCTFDEVINEIKDIFSVGDLILRGI